jgi:HAD superfamily hydrolase (TIGR01484 family)
MKLIITDVDGCINARRWASVDLAAMQQVRSMSVPLYLASGRSQPYLECLGQMLSNSNPFICENGSAIFDPKAGVYSWIEPAANLVAQSKSDVLNALNYLKEFKFELEPGKDFSLSLATKDSNQVLLHPSAAFPHVVECLSSFIHLDVTHSGSAIDITGKAVNKGKALVVLAEQIGTHATEMAGFGDSQNDLSFLDLVGISGGPSNASVEIQKRVDFLSTKRDIHGLIDFFCFVERRN